MLLSSGLVAQIAPSIVPKNWNISPLAAGAYLEGFEAAEAPAWIGAGYSVLVDEFPALEPLPARLNTWFGTSTKVLSLDTAGEVLMNNLSYDDQEAVTFAEKPVYVDMLLRFDPVVSEPELEELEDAKLALYINEDGELSAFHADSTGEPTKSLYAPDPALVLDKWYQVTLVLLAGQADVMLNDTTVFSALPLLEKTANEGKLSAVSFSGTGLLDNLYVSHGDPAYAIMGPTVSVPSLPDASGLDDEEVTSLHRFMQDQGADGDTSLKSGTTQTQLNTAFLLNALAVADNEAAVPSFEFGIASIDVLDADKVRVTARLTVDEQPKVGTINGKIQLLGKVTEADESWTTLAGAVTPAFADFTSGEATYDFELPEGGYAVFKTQIIP